MKNYLRHIMILMATLFGVILFVGINYELFEGLTGKIYKYHPNAGIYFGLLEKNMTPTNLFYWELDFFRIVVHLTFALCLTSTIIFFSTVFKHKRFDKANLIIVFLSAIITINIPFMIIQFSFFLVAPYILSLFLWLNSTLAIVVSSILIYKLKTNYINYRNYSLELKAYFTDVKNVDILGYFSHNDYHGIIKYSNEDKMSIFEEENGEYVIYLSGQNVRKIEDEFIKKVGYWSYYIDKVVSRLKNQELDYHENALKYANKLLEENLKGKKKKHEKN